MLEEQAIVGLRPAGEAESVMADEVTARAASRLTVSARERPNGSNSYGTPTDAIRIPYGYPTEQYAVSTLFSGYCLAANAVGGKKKAEAGLKPPRNQPRRVGHIVRRFRLTTPVLFHKFVPC